MGQLYLMDKLNVNKEEMSHPVKHIVINNKNRPVLLDFERARHVKSQGNVTQFCDFLMSNKISTALKERNISINGKKMISAAKKYKKNQNKESVMNIIGEIK